MKVSILSRSRVCIFWIAILAMVSADRAGSAELPGAEKTSLITIERNIVRHTNRQRSKHGLPPVEVCPRLMRSAREHAAWMTRTRNLVHTSKMVAENIAMGQRSSREAVADWMTSPGHRANILDRRNRRIGVAAYRTTDGTIFWCQQFLR